MMHGWGFGGGGGGGYGAVRRFEEQYHCYSVAAADKAHMEVSLSSSCLFYMSLFEEKPNKRDEFRTDPARRGSCVRTFAIRQVFHETTNS